METDIKKNETNIINLINKSNKSNIEELNKFCEDLKKKYAKYHDFIDQQKDERNKTNIINLINKSNKSNMEELNKFCEDLKKKYENYHDFIDQQKKENIINLIKNVKDEKQFNELIKTFNSNNSDEKTFARKEMTKVLNSKSESEIKKNFSSFEKDSTKDNTKDNTLEILDLKTESDLIERLNIFTNKLRELLKNNRKGSLTYTVKMPDIKLLATSKDKTSSTIFEVKINAKSLYPETIKIGNIEKYDIKYTDNSSKEIYPINYVHNGNTHKINYDKKFHLMDVLGVMIAENVRFNIIEKIHNKNLEFHTLENLYNSLVETFMAGVYTKWAGWNNNEGNIVKMSDHEFKVECLLPYLTDDK